MSRQRLEFLIIDPQVDFCDPNGALFVKGADEDSIRLGNTIKRLKNRIDDIHVTLDTHHYVDIAHPIFWVDSNGNHPSPGTIITIDDFMNGIWRPTNPAYMNRETMKKIGGDRDGVKEYLESLKANNRYVLCIWPPHCLIGSPGHNVISPIYDALIEWEKDFTMVDYVTKGSNFMTEHYSAVKADVVDPTDPGTMLNNNLIQTLENADIIALSGQALDFCVANTIRDIANNFGDESIKKMVLLIDTTSAVNVPGLEHLANDFLNEMKSRGMQVCKCEDFI